MSTPTLGIDLGGTKLAWGLVGSRGQLRPLGTGRTPTTHEGTLRALAQIISRHPAPSVGIAIAGTFQGTTLTATTNLPLEAGVDLQTITKKRLVLENDAVAALRAEHKLGALQTYKNAVYVSLGTGIGGAVLQNNTVVDHPRDILQEISRVVLTDHDHFPWPTGEGSVEALLGGHALAARFGITVEQLALGVRNGEADAVRTWNFIPEHMAELLSVLAHDYDPEAFCIGGAGLANLDLYLRGVQSTLPILPAKLGQQSAWVGAGLSAQQPVDTTDPIWYKKIAAKARSVFPARTT